MTLVLAERYRLSFMDRIVPELNAVCVVNDTVEDGFRQRRISAVNNKGLMRFMCCKGALNAALFIAFLKRLIKTADKKVFLIVDNLRVHRAARVSHWSAGHRNEIELFFLPAYTPEPNPVKYLNNDVKQE